MSKEPDHLCLNPVGQMLVVDVAKVGEELFLPLVQWVKLPEVGAQLSVGVLVHIHLPNPLVIT